MTEKGFVVKFDETKGFGFIRQPGAEKDRFVHINDVAGRVALVPGQEVTFEPFQAPKGPAARKVVPGRLQRSPVGLFLFVAVLLAGSAAVLGVHYALPWLLACLLGVNLATLLLYGYDKAVAGGRKLRVPEAVLQLLAFLGGSPAAFAGQFLFRHKTRKSTFQRLFWLIVTLQIVLVGGWAWCCINRPAWIPDALEFLFPRL